MTLGLGLTTLAPLLFYCLVIVALPLTLFRSAEWGLYLMVILIPLQGVMHKLHKYPLGNDIFDILLVAIVIGLLFQRRKKTQEIPYSRALNRAIIAIILITYSGLWVGSLKLGLPFPTTWDNPQLIQWKNYAILPLLYFITLYAVRDRRQIILIVWLMMITMLFMDNNFYHTFRWFKATGFHDGLRTTGVFSYLGPNELAGFYVQYTMLLIGIFLYDKDKLRRLALLAVISFNFYVIIFLYSRSAYLAAAVGLAGFGILKNRLILVLLVVILMSWQTVLPISVVQRIDMSHTQETGTDTSILGRLQMWKKAFDIFLINPVTGVGFGSTKYLGFRCYPGNKSRGDIHNGYLEVLLETGLLGFIALMTIFTIAIKKAWTLYRQTDDSFLKGLGLGFVMCIVASLVSNLTGDKWSYLSVMGYFWILMGLVARATIMMTKQMQNLPFAGDTPKQYPRSQHGLKLFGVRK